jgi:hypothetical protein
MSLGSIFTTVFMDRRRSDYCARLSLPLCELPPSPGWLMRKQASFPRKGLLGNFRPAHPAKTSPDARLCTLAAKHKILCRGQKSSDARRSRQYLATDSVTPFLFIINNRLCNYGPCWSCIFELGSLVWERNEGPYMLCTQVVHILCTGSSQATLLLEVELGESHPILRRTEGAWGVPERCGHAPDKG